MHHRLMITDFPTGMGKLDTGWDKTRDAVQTGIARRRPVIDCLLCQGFGYIKRLVPARPSKDV